MNIIQRLSVLLTILVIAASAFAQTAATAELHGVVKDPNGAVIQGATISLHDEAKNITRSAQSNEAGEYNLLSIPPGEYTLTVSAKGFSKVIAKQVTLNVGQAAQYPVTMQLATAETEITVTGEPLLIETSKTSTSTTIGQQRIENLPINGRNYVNFSLTNSQVQRDVAPSIGAAPTSGLNFGGQRARSNAVNVDGMDAVDNSVNGIRSTISQEGVQEFQIITNGYEAEYGRASGGVVNIITKSGTNDFHGSAFGYLRNRNIQAQNPFSNTPDPAYTRAQAGIAFGGPIKKDRTYYYFSFETTRRQETGFSTIGAGNFGLVPLANAASFGLPAGSLVTPAQAQFLAGAPSPASPFFPVFAGYAQLAAGGSAVALAGAAGAPGPLGAFPTSGAPLPASFHGLLSQVGNYPVSEATDVYSLRFDHKFNLNNQLMVRAGLSPSDVTGIQVNAQNQDFGQNAFSRTSTQSYHDGSIGVQDTWILGANKINDARYQYSRRSLLYNFSPGAGGGDVAVNIPGFAFFGREPFSFVQRVEQRHQIGDNFSWIKGRHNIKFGADINYLPVTADFTVNFGGIYNFGELTSGSLNSNFSAVGAPNFSAVQAYGLGIPQVFIQGVGNPHDTFNMTTLGFFLQDSWRMNNKLTVNYGVRYDYELSPVFNAVNALSQTAQDALGITQGIPRDSNNVAPRVGFSFDPKGDGKTVIRASYGLFYDHPLLALAFDSDVADGSQAPQFILFGGSPCNPAGPASPLNALNLNATNAFQGLLDKGNCLPAGLASGLDYLSAQQRFNPAPNAPSLFTGQQFLGAGIPLISLPFGFPTGNNFQYGYAEQGGFSIEHDLGHELAFSAAYNFTGGHHLNRPINVNPTDPKALIENWERANAAGGNFSSPLNVNTCGVGPAGPFVPAALMSFFRKSGLNPSLTGLFPPACIGLANTVAAQYGLGVGAPVPFSDMVANFSNGSSVYHGLTVNLRKRMKNHFEFLGSYTWSHAIDDSTDLQTLLSPQNDLRPDLERANSTFDQRHRFVFSGMYQSGKVGENFWNKLFSNWTLAPIIEFSSGRPFNIVTATDQNFNFSTSTDRPNAVTSGTATNACGFPTVPSKASPTGAFQIPCFIDSNPLDGTFTGSLDGNLGRNAGTRPMTIFTDMRVARMIPLGERLKLEGSMDVFNFINRFNVADVNSLYTEAGQPTAAFDPRQFQFGMKLSW